MQPALFTVSPGPVSVLPAPVILSPRVHPVASQSLDLSIIIVNYHCWHDTAALVRQLRSRWLPNPDKVEVVVVDNHSPGHALVSKLRRLTGVALRRWGRNRGFARAVNEGCRLSQGHWMLLLNPDVTVPVGFVEAALKQAEQLVETDSRTGVIGFGLLNSNGTRQRSFGPFPTLVGSLARLLLPRSCRKYYIHHPQEPCRVPWVTGCCLLVRRDCFQEVGGFDEDFFLYYEDVDFCRRAQAKGWSVWYEPGVNVTHHSPLHTRPVPPHLRLITRHAFLTFARKHWPGWQFQVLAGLIAASAWFRSRLARWSGDPVGAETFATLQVMARDLAGGRLRVARQRLNHLVRRREKTLVA